MKNLKYLAKDLDLALPLIVLLFFLFIFSLILVYIVSSIGKSVDSGEYLGIRIGSEKSVVYDSISTWIESGKVKWSPTNHFVEKVNCFDTAYFQYDVWLLSTSDFDVTVDREAKVLFNKNGRVAELLTGNKDSNSNVVYSNKNGSLWNFKIGETKEEILRKMCGASFSNWDSFWIEVEQIAFQRNKMVETFAKDDSWEFRVKSGFERDVIQFEFKNGKLVRINRVRRLVEP